MQSMLSLLTPVLVSSTPYSATVKAYTRAIRPNRDSYLVVAVLYYCS